MKIGPTVRTALFIGALASGSTLHAATMSNDDYRAVKSRIEVEYKDSKTACDQFSGNAKDICREEAKGKEKVARAELEYNRSGNPGDSTKVAIAKADATYAVARERCDDRAGNEKDVCVKEAKAMQTRALADAKMNRKVGEARKDAAGDKRDAEYSVAKEKCEALAGDSKAQCVASAKSRYGKT